MIPTTATACAETDDSAPDEGNETPEPTIPGELIRGIYKNIRQ